MADSKWLTDARQAVAAAELAHDFEQDADELGEENFEAVAERLLSRNAPTEREIRISAAVLSVVRAYERGGIRALATACAAIPDDIAADCHGPVKRAILGR